MKIGVILDNPLRDMHGVVLLSYHLVRQGHQVFLIPMYDQELLIRRLKPNLVILNFARKANAQAIRSYHDANIRIAILDTEGGILRCEYKELVNIVEASGSKDWIHYYFVWGSRQMKAFQKKLGATKTKWVLTGSPRMDFYHDNWAKHIDRPPLETQEYAFIPTSFSFNNPKFVSRKREIGNMQEAMGTELSSLCRIQAKYDTAQSGITAILQRLAKKHADITFVLRPHPFENEDFYTQAFQDIPNVRIRRDGHLNDWLKYAKLVLQFNSSSAVEAALYGKPVISFEMFQDPEIEAAQAGECSIRPKTEEEFFEIFDRLWNGKTNPRIDMEIQQVREGLNQIVRDWLHRVDGNSAQRIAEFVDSAIAAEIPHPHSIRFERLGLRVTWLWFYFFLRRIYAQLKPGKLQRARTKFFSAQDISRWIDKFNREASIPIQVRDVSLFQNLPMFKTTAVELKLTH